MTSVEASPPCVCAIGTFLVIAIPCPKRADKLCMLSALGRGNATECGWEAGMGGVLVQRGEGHTMSG